MPEMKSHVLFLGFVSAPLALTLVGRNSSSLEFPPKFIFRYGLISPLFLSIECCFASHLRFSARFLDQITMETTTISQISDSKKLKSSQEHTNGDRISSLPNSILHHILSYRSLHYAVQTSVLSRRWRYLWTSLPTLNFNFELSSFHYRKRPDVLKDFVDQALLQRDNSNVQRFELNYGETVRLNSWILCVLRRNVREMCLKLSVNRPFQLPHCLFTCSTLTLLELNFWGIRKCRNKLCLPDSISLPALKTLILASIVFEDSDAINNFFSKCPLLESLTLRDCEMHHTHIIISSLKLKHLVINAGDGGFENNDAADGSLKLYAPNLIYFCCQDYLFKSYLFENLSSLVEARIHMDIEEEITGYSELSVEDKETADRNMMKFLKDVQHVKALTLSASVIQVVSRAYALLEGSDIQFCNLRCLEIESVLLSKDCIHGIAYLLKISPNVETLSLSMDEYEQYQEEPLDDQPKYAYWDETKFPPTSTEDYWESGLSLQSMLYHLKSVEIRSIIGCVNELKFLEILLKNAMVLKKVLLYHVMEDMYPSFKRNQKDDAAARKRRMMKFSKKLVTFPTAASRVAFLFF